MLFTNKSCILYDLDSGGNAAATTFGHHFWAPFLAPQKELIFRLPVTQTSNPEQDLGSSDGHSGIIWNRSGVVLGCRSGFILGSVLSGIWNRSDVTLGSLGHPCGIVLRVLWRFFGDALGLFGGALASSRSALAAIG